MNRYRIILAVIIVLLSGCAGTESIETTAAIETVQETEKPETETAAPKFNAEAYKAECIPVNYREFFRYEDRYKGTKVYQILEVSQVMNNGDLRCYSDSDGDGFTDDEYYVQDNRQEKDMRILKDDKIVVWGIYAGTSKLTRAINDVQEDVFTIDAEIIELLDESGNIAFQGQTASGNIGAESGGLSENGTSLNKFGSVPSIAANIFGSDGTDWSWKSDSTGYYIIPYCSDGTYYIWFALENNTIWANAAYTVEVSEMESTPSGGLICRGEMYRATKENPEYNGIVEVTWNSMESIDFCSVKMVDGHQLTDVDMVADDYSYYGITDDSIGGELYLGNAKADEYYEADDGWRAEFVFPYSDIDVISDDELKLATDEQLRIGKNEIYANHGRMFSSQELQDYFNSCSWYTPSIRPEDFNESVFSEIEKKNIQRIQAEIDRRSR